MTVKCRLKGRKSRLNKNNKEARCRKYLKCVLDHDSQEKMEEASFGSYQLLKDIKQNCKTSTHISENRRTLKDLINLPNFNKKEQKSKVKAFQKNTNPFEILNLQLRLNNRPPKETTDEF